MAFVDKISENELMMINELVQFDILINLLPNFGMKLWCPFQNSNS